MTPLDRLLAEAIPDGTFGGSRPTTRHPQPTPHLWTPDQQQAHYAELDAALEGWDWDRPRRRTERRHLRALPDAA